MQQLQKRALSHHRRATIALNTRSCSLERKFVCKRLVAPAAPADHPDSDSSTRTDGAPAVTDRDMLWDLCTGHWRTQAVRAVVKLGVVDSLGLTADSPVSVTSLAAHTQCNEDHLYRLMQFLAQFGVFIEGPTQHFKLTSLGSLLKADHPSQMRNMALYFGDPARYNTWFYVDKAVKEGTSAFAQYRPDLPGGVFEYHALPENREEEQHFNQMMTTVTKSSASHVVALHDFDCCSSVADIGGGHGQLLMDIMDKYPGVQQGVVLELPSVVETVPPVPERFKHKLTWVQGDFFHPVPVSASCYIMKSILHDWSDEDCVKILRNIKAAMPVGAKLANFDRIMPAGEAALNKPHPVKMMDMNMMAMCNGKERTPQQWQQLFGAAGFIVVDMVDDARMGVIVVVPVTSD